MECGAHHAHEAAAGGRTQVRQPYGHLQYWRAAPTDHSTCSRLGAAAGQAHQMFQMTRKACATHTCRYVSRCSVYGRLRVCSVLHAMAASLGAASLPGGATSGMHHSAWCTHQHAQDEHLNHVAVHGSWRAGICRVIQPVRQARRLASGQYAGIAGTIVARWACRKVWHVHPRDRAQLSLSLCR